MTTAQAIKKELKKKFPETKFSITKWRGTALFSLSINWTDWPSKQEVRLVTSKYTYGEFDSMTDSRDINKTEGIELVLYLTYSRMMSEELL